jgi:hypothetical protein
MDTALFRVSLSVLTDDQLFEFLHTSGDALSRDVVDEILRRREAVLGRLTDLLRDEAAWQRSGEAYWAPVHATFILGALEDERSLRGLLAAFRNSLRHDVDWIHERLPALFGPLGRPALPALKASAMDAAASELERTTAVRCLAGVAAHQPIHQGEVLDLLRAMADDESEAEAVRTAAAEVLLAFVRPGDRRVAASAAIRQQWSDRPARFELSDVEEAWAAGLQRLDAYRADWLQFYAPEAAEARRLRWAEEAEDRRWAGAGAEWVGEQVARFLVKYEFTLGELDDAERGDATWVAESLAEYLVWYEGTAPWRLNRDTVFGYLMDTFSRRVAADHPGRVESVPPAILRYARFCAGLGKVGVADLDAVESVVASEHEAFVAAAQDPERRRVAREVLERLVAQGIDPRDPERVPAPATPVPASKDRPTERRRRPR